MPEVPLIAIVDDDGFVRESTKGLIRSMGYAAETFASAEEYLRSNRVADTACLISDIHMPDMNGFDVQASLLRVKPTISVIIITGHDSAEGYARAMAAHPIAYLRKPIEGKPLLDAIQTALSGADDSLL